MMVAVELQAWIEAARDAFFPLSMLCLVMYPVGLIVWTSIEGMAFAKKAEEAEKEAFKRATSSVDVEEDAKKPFSAEKPAVVKPAKARNSRQGTVIAVGTAAAAAACAAVWQFGMSGVCTGFVASLSSWQPNRGTSRRSSVNQPAAPAEAPLSSGADVAASRESVTTDSTSGYLSTLCGCAVAAGIAAAAAVARRARPRYLSQASRVLRKEAACPKEVPLGFDGVPVYSPPGASSFSFWHDVDLQVRTWLDQETGLFRYVNEIPSGSLQKFEVMVGDKNNAITEDTKGSERLRAYGVPVPFNYGCFPQTFRDPADVDPISGVGGDNDPLDVLDLCHQAVGVGEIVSCRPLGAVCLIDEGQADWKILAVNVEADSPLAECRSIEDVERVAPGRVKEVLNWIHGLKCGKQSDIECTLKFDIIDAERAVQFIMDDHASWKKLLQEAGPDGRARGHWIRDPKAQPVPSMGWATQKLTSVLAHAFRPQRSVSLVAGAEHVKNSKVRVPTARSSSPASRSLALRTVRRQISPQRHFRVSSP
eukprot:TRINITY_DN12468_c0_g1_i1.p1 TRINITY_DN12468_c0_g1~~TRINITY_DN12468_c0_g1_i1.p1  ORF type:complete len:535 (+),score=123.89 TRINITY_DN12468_c0_g1_i1:105-1709(+)